MTIQTDTAINRDTSQFSDPSAFEQLLDREFKPKGDEQRDAVVAAVRTLAEQALINTVTMSDDAYDSIEAIKSKVEQKPFQQINLNLHPPYFQPLESPLRRMDQLVSNT